MKIRFPLKGYLSLQFGAVAVLPVILIFFLVWGFMMPGIQTRTTNQHQTMARAIAGQISAYLEGGARQLTALAEYLQNQALDPDQNVVELLDSQCGRGAFFEVLFVVDKRSVVVQAVGLARSRRANRADYMGLDFSGRRFTNPSKSLKKAFWSQTFLSTVSSRMAVALTVPLADGFITGEVTLGNLSEFISLLPVESQFLTLIVDGQGLVVADSQKRRSGQVLNVDDPVARQAAGGTQSASTTFELDGVKMLGTWVEMDAVGWRVLFAQPVKKAFQPLRDTFTLIGLGLAIALGLALLVAWLLASHLTGLFASYADKAQSIANGNYHLKWPAARTKEFFQLSQSLERMAENINQREKALVDSEARLGNLVANVPGVVYQFKADPNAIESSSLTSVVGERSIELFGLDARQEIFFTNFVRCLPADDQPRFVESVKAALETAAPWYYEGRFNKPSGEKTWFEGRSVPRRIDGELVYYGVFTDITQRKEMESSLRLTQFIVDKAPIGVWRMGPAGEVLDVNEQGCTSLGYSREELRQMTIFDFAPGFDTRDLENATSQLREAGTQTIEALHQRKSGEIFPVQVISKLLRFGGREYHLAFVQDITERNRAGESMRITQFSFDNANIGIYRIAPDAQVIQVNQKAAQLLGYTRAELETLSILDIDTLITRETWERVWQDLLEKRTQAFEREHRRKDGSVISVDVYGSLLEYEGQQYSIAFVQDITERKQMERALKEGEQRLDLALSGANEGIWDWRIAEDILYLDSRYYTMAGYEPDAFPARFDEIQKRIHEDDVARVQSVNDRYLAGELKAFAVEFRFLRKDGSHMWIQAKGKIVDWDDRGNPLRFIGTHTDITARKQAEEALRKNEQLLNDILDSMNEGLLVLDSDFKYTIFNRSLAKMVEMPKEAALGKTPWDAFPYLKDTPVEKNIKKTMAGKSTQKLETQVPVPGKGLAWIRDSYSPLKDARGRVIGVVGVISDITRRKQDDEELRRLRNYLSNIIDSMPSIIVAVDREGMVTQWNQRAAQATGLIFEEARSRPLARVFPSLTDEMGRIESVIREDRVISSSKVSRKVDNETRFEDITIFPLVANRVEGAVIRVDDVTQQVRLEEMMIQSEKMLSVGGLAAGMAHEINNPLAGILQNAEVLENRLLGDLPANRQAAEAAGITPAAIRHYLILRRLPDMIGSIRESGTRAATIVRNMLSFARKSDKAVSPHNLGTLMDQTIDLLKTDYDMKKHYDFKRIKIHRLYEEAAGPVLCEASKIQQVFMNILKNGAEAMAEVADAAVPPTFTLRVRNEGAWVRVEIEDNGPGMDKATRRRIFEPFFTTKPVGKGTGLGLSVSYFIVTEDHGGEMSVETVEGGGSCFVIRLPQGGGNR